MTSDAPTPRRPRLRPRSVTGLLIAGFAFVALPLVVATVFAVVYVERLANQSERLIAEGVAVTRLSNQLTTNLIDMERNARQYAVLDEPAIAERFAENHMGLKQTLARIAALNLNALPDWDLAALRMQAQQVAGAVAAQPFSADALKAEMQRFERMREIARVIGAEGNQFIDTELAGIQSTSGEVRLFLLLCTFALIPATLLLVGLFTAVISRPIHQIRRAVQRLGEGDLTQPVAISAPSAELDALGDHLDWMRRRLEALESEKNLFLQHMSHELKTPLASIREGAELLRDGTLGAVSREQSEVVDIVQQSSRELTTLIENLLDFAAWKQKHQQIDAEVFYLHDVAASVVARHRLAIEARRLDLVLPEQNLQIYADRDRIRLALDNLIANAVKFSPEGGIIRIDGRRGREATTIEITDEGPGIKKSERQHVFTPFYQAAPDAGRHVRGTGIGLSVVKEGVQAHGGDIEIVDHAGGGACFRIRLPHGATH